MKLWKFLSGLLVRAKVPPPELAVPSIVHTDAATYGPALAAALADWTDDAADRLGRLMQSLPDKTRSVDIGIYPDQDGEGCVTVMAQLDGPDLHVLNHAVVEYRELFSVRSTSQGRVPPVPLVNGLQEDFATNDVIVDVATAWVLDVWQRSKAAEVGKSGYVFGDEGYGTVARTKLP